jgi:hypothetical protein
MVARQFNIFVKCLFERLEICLDDFGKIVLVKL